MDKLFESCFKNISGKRNLPESKDYYYRNYWLQMYLWYLNSMSIIVAIFDNALDQGYVTAIKRAQRLAGAKETGIMDRNTSKLINNHIKSFTFAYNHDIKMRKEYKKDMEEEQKRLNSINLKR